MKYLFVTTLAGLLAAAALWSDVAGPTVLADGRKLPLPAAEPANLTFAPPAKIRNWYYNHGNTGDPEGDCVQCSLGIAAVRQNLPAAETLCWNTPYGDAIRGGSTPSRVAEYCRARQIAIWNVTGEGTLSWAEWAARNGRAAAIFFFPDHFQTQMGRQGKNWLVCNNNTPWQLDPYSDGEFRQIHRNSGQWIVVFDGPAAPPAATKPTR